MAYILGEREFWGLPFKVSPAVLVPRPDSETLIEAALALMLDRDRPWRILDLGLGSGCLLLTLLREFPAAVGVGMELSTEALAVAQSNAEALGVARRARLVPGDWRQAAWQEGLGGPFDLLVSNPPYVEADAIERLMPEVARFEPRLALDGGPDGLAAYRAIARAAPSLLSPGGRILVEVGEGQATEISSIFGSAGLVDGTLLERPGRHRARDFGQILKSWQAGRNETTFRTAPWGGLVRANWWHWAINPSEI